ncbi:DUF262 domain-containing protein [Cohnella fermenti]|uniref:DUF262 domain-containing protein n=1 Tax=Cohnella fermenti TaxID=2565925 RepID=A0A4S4BNU0_9BACL|nr:DUF262 domain-containing protein [Cohnella fermenti]THF76546.1 DUF262 domain-containing protein [Cohnella fermenti]
MMAEHPVNTLLKLLAEFRVEIPIVQRDYAQGRQDPDTTIVRETLLADIRTAIREQKNPVELNFVYGKVEGDTFIPIDGQQRLTTLFLLHIYAFADDPSRTELFKKFSYETRTSSRDFLEKLTLHRSAVFTDAAAPSAEIEDSEWFVAGWKYDPTIQSALTMLDDIKQAFCEADNLAHCLSNPAFEPVVFKFLEMKELGMEDSLYIKLNSRGKPLTPFENFKAQLIGRLQKLKLPMTVDFEQRFDREWTDLFWANSQKSFDQTFLAFFGEILINKGLLVQSSNWERGLSYDRISADVFEAAYNTLTYLCSNLNDAITHRLVFKALSANRNYQDRVIFHAITTYFHSSKGIKEESYEQWLRIMKNLTLNSTIDEISLYHRAVEGINHAAKHWDSLLDCFAQGGSIVGFSSEQVKEEQEKAKLIAGDAAFAQAIYDAEEHPYFSGQIRSALHYSIGPDNLHDKNSFVRYWTKISALIGHTGPIHGNLLRQALLSLGDYTLPVGAYRTLCVNDPNEAASTPSLKRLFSNHGAIVKRLLDAIADAADVEGELKALLAGATVPQSDWRYCFILVPALFNEMSASHYRLREIDGEMILVPNKSTNGYSYGVFLTALCEQLKSKHAIELLQDVLGTWADRYLSVKGLEIRYKNNKFIITNNGNPIYETQSDRPIAEVMASGLL